MNKAERNAARKWLIKHAEAQPCDECGGKVEVNPERFKVIDWNTRSALLETRCLACSNPMFHVVGAPEFVRPYLERMQGGGGETGAMLRWRRFFVNSQAASELRPAAFFETCATIGDACEMGSAELSFALDGLATLDKPLEALTVRELLAVLDDARGRALQTLQAQGARDQDPEAR